MNSKLSLLLVAIFCVVGIVTVQDSSEEVKPNEEVRVEIFYSEKKITF